jgi:cell wall-associated NlpC family hydrolase
MPLRLNVPAHRALRAALLVCVLAGGTAAWAAPAPATPTAGDALLQMLQDKGLAPLQQAGRSLAQAGRSATDTAGQVASSAAHTASEVVLSALNFLGVPYKRGGNDADQGFDCSGFTRHLFAATLGLVLPRSAKEQAQAAGLQEVEKTELQPGDLVFFNTMRRAFSHVGIYIGDGRFVHSPRAGGQVRVESMRESYWTHRYNGARRVEWPAVADASAATPTTSAATAAVTPTAPVAAPATGLPLRSAARLQGLDEGHARGRAADLRNPGVAAANSASETAGR